MKRFKEYQFEAAKNKNLVTTTHTGKVDITDMAFPSALKSKINKELDALYRKNTSSYSDKKFNPFLSNLIGQIEDILEKYDVCFYDEEYSKGVHSYSIRDNMNEEISFNMGQLSSIVDTGLGYSPVSKIYKDAVLKMFIYVVKKENTGKVESIYIG
jgi:hypothetical protein